MKRIGTVAREAVADGRFARIAYPPFDVLVAIVDGEPTAIEDACNHAGASLAEGDRSGDGRCVACPLHGYTFNLSTGALVEPKGLCGPQRAYRAEIIGDEIVVFDDFELTLL
jgi:nitrite reductase/ring-hydroxylating ferredoxin subunit